MAIKTLALLAASVVLTANALAESNMEPPGHSPLVAVPNEPAPMLTVGAPLAEPLARGVALIPYRVENFRILPVLGSAALEVSPRVGHLHVSIDDLPWRWGDFSSSNTIVLAGLPPGEHKLLIELADPTHRILAAQSVTFTVPATKVGKH
jgi:hypothetical protein